jgi:hypothetical protein
VKYIPIVGLGLAIIGLITLDWFKVGFGVLLFVGGFIFDLFKKKGVMNDDKIFASYKIVSQLIRIIKSFETAEVGTNRPKAKLAQGLFYLGMVDAASQSANMDDSQFFNLFKAVFTDLDYDFDERYQSKLLIFHQSLASGHAAFPAIMKGGELFINFASGSSTAPLAGNILIKKLIEDADFPSSVEEL